MLSLELKYLAQKLRQIVLFWLFLRIRRNILKVARAKTLFSFIIGKNVWLSNKKKVKVKLGRKISFLKAIIKILKRYVYYYYFKPEFLLFFKYIYKLTALVDLVRGKTKTQNSGKSPWYIKKSWLDMLLIL